MSTEAWKDDDPTACPTCGRDTCDGSCVHAPTTPKTNDEDASREVRFIIDVGERKERLRVDREARRQLDAEERGPVPEPVFLTLAERLDRPRPEAAYRISRWQPRDTRVVLAAQYKAGKTTLVANLLASLADGDPFLGEATRRIDGAVCLIDTEMPEALHDAWLADVGIRNADRVWPVSLRGLARAFDITDPAIRTRWATEFRQREVRYVILDCLRPVLDALGLDEHKDAGRFLVQFDALLEEADITEAAIVQHMGHAGERSRGDSRLLDWPDVSWRLVRQDDNPSSPRFISAYGRDVDIAESRLEFDPTTRRLSMAGGSREDAKTEAALGAVLGALNGQPMSGRAIKDELAGTKVPRDTIDAALRLGIRTGALRSEKGPRNAKLYSSVRVSGSVREASGGHSPDPVSECPAALIEPDTPDTPGGRSAEEPSSVSGPDTQSCCEGGRLKPGCKLCRESPTYYGARP